MFKEINLELGLPQEEVLATNGEEILIGYLSIDMGGVICCGVGQTLYDIDKYISTVELIHLSNKPPKQYKKYGEQEFLTDWKYMRQKYMNAPTHIKAFTPYERTLFNNLTEKDQDEIKKAMEALFRQQNITIKRMLLRPDHFLRDFDTYLTAYYAKDSKLYGEAKKVNKL